MVPSKILKICSVLLHVSKYPNALDEQAYVWNKLLCSHPVNLGESFTACTTLLKILRYLFEPSNKLFRFTFITYTATDHPSNMSICLNQPILNLWIFFLFSWIWKVTQSVINNLPNTLELPDSENGKYCFSVHTKLLNGYKKKIHWLQQTLTIL